MKLIRAKISRFRRVEELEGYAFISPWLVGFLAFTLVPIAASLYISFCRWNMLLPPVWIGPDHYTKLFTGADPKFVKSLMVTAYYTCVSVPLSVICSIVLAMLLNCRLKGIGLFRTIFYLPSVASGVAVAVLWMWLFNTDHGLLNYGLAKLGIARQAWLQDEKLVIPALVMMSMWGIGSTTILYLAGLQGIPDSLYEAADIDGAGPISRFFHITLPLLSPVIFFNVIIAVIASFQVFTQGFIMTDGGPNDASMFYVLYLFKNAFQYFRMGYACAMAWILFLVILLLTLVQLWLARRWVYYEAGETR